MAVATKPEVTRVTVNLPEKVWEALTELADEKSISKTDALRRAISTEVFLNQAIKEGAEVLLRRKDGTVERLIFQY